MFTENVILSFSLSTFTRVITERICDVIEQATRLRPGKGIVAHYDAMQRSAYLAYLEGFMSSFLNALYG